MTKYLLGLLTLLLLSCDNSESTNNRSNQIVNPDELIYKEGDCLTFKIDSSTYGAGVVFDFSKDEAGVWYGILLTDYQSPDKPNLDSIIKGRFLGRKVQSSLNEKGFIIALDAEYILDSLLANNFSLVSHISLNNEIKLGAQGATSSMEKLSDKLRSGFKRRLTPPDDYRDHLSKMNDFRPDEYFYVKDFLEM